MLNTLSARDAAGFAADAALNLCQGNRRYVPRLVAGEDERHARTDQIRSGKRNFSDMFCSLSEARAADRALRVKADCNRSFDVRTGGKPNPVDAATGTLHGRNMRKCEALRVLEQVTLDQVCGEVPKVISTHRATQQRA